MHPTAAAIHYSSLAWDAAFTYLSKNRVMKAETPKQSGDNGRWRKHDSTDPNPIGDHSITQMCEKLQAVWILSVSKDPRWENDRSWQWKSFSAANHWGMLVLLLRSQSGEEISRKMWPQYDPSP